MIQDVDLRIKQLLSASLNVDLSDVTDQASLYEDLDCESLDLIEICMEIEDLFLISIPDDQLPNFCTVSSIVDYVKLQVRDIVPGSI